MTGTSNDGDRYKRTLKKCGSLGGEVLEKYQKWGKGIFYEVYTYKERRILDLRTFS